MGIYFLFRAAPPIITMQAAQKEKKTLFSKGFKYLKKIAPKTMKEAPFIR